MKIAVASGKGGTGKTLLSTSLAVSMSRLGHAVQYVDCDVEEPNGHIFLKATVEQTEAVTIGVPEVDQARCNGCGRCGELCQYSAILCLPGQVLTFEELCHSCGGCSIICPEGAIVEKPRPIGELEFGQSESLAFAQGCLAIGAVQSPTMIRVLKERAAREGIMILDSPPGTSCPVVETLHDVDFVLLITEPTPFGQNDLELAVAMVRELERPFAVVINRSDVGDSRVKDYCRVEDVPVLLEIKNDRAIAEVYSRGELLIDALEGYDIVFKHLYDGIMAHIKTGG
ncbi:P-loop NTPase [Planctomycetota bacterium]